jgi:hypothetical protein
MVTIGHSAHPNQDDALTSLLASAAPGPVVHVWLRLLTPGDAVRVAQNNRAPVGHTNHIRSCT